MRNIPLLICAVVLHRFRNSRWRRRRRFSSNVGCLPLLLKRSTRRTRVPRCYDASILDSRRWPEASWSAGADHAAAHGRDGRTVIHRSFRQLPGINTRQISIHRTRVHERLVRYNRDAIVYTLIHVCDVGDVIHGVVVVNVRDLGDAHARIRDVDVVHVNAAYAVRGDVDLTWSQREPAHTFSDSNGEVEATASNERDQRRSVHWTHINRTRHPAPAAFHEGPSAVMEWCEAPRFVLNPRPTPRRDPHPVSEAIRRPSRGD